jgi:hypothetical protein
MQESILKLSPLPEFIIVDGYEAGTKKHFWKKFTADEISH